MIHLPRVLEVAGEIQEFCRQQRWRFCFIGGVAVQRWGEPLLQLKGAVDAMDRLERMLVTVEQRLRGR